METQRETGGERRQKSESISSGGGSPEKLNQQKKRKNIYIFGYGYICGEREIYLKDLAPS